MSKQPISKEIEKICIIGAANIDLTGLPDAPLIDRDANLGRLHISMGGVGRNIAENLSRLNKSVQLIAPIGNDAFAKQLLDHAKKQNLDMSHSFFSKERSSIHISILDRQNDMAMGFSAMSICQSLTPAFIQTKKNIIQSASLVVFENSIREDVLMQVVKDNPQQLYILDTVSVALCKRVKNIYPHLFLLKTNRMEAMALTGMAISDNSQLRKAAAYFHQRGVKNIAISLGAEGLFFSSRQTQFILQSNKVIVKNTVGAGDALLAGMTYGILGQHTIEKCAAYGMAMAELNIQHLDMVHPELNEPLLNKVLNKGFSINK